MKLRSNKNIFGETCEFHSHHTRVRIYISHSSNKQVHNRPFEFHNPYIPYGATNSNSFLDTAVLERGGVN